MCYVNVVEIMDEISKTLESLMDTHIERILKVLRQPTIFSDLPNIRKCAEIYLEYLQEAGFQETTLIETDRSPLVYGEVNCDAPKTVLIYNFFDMLPGKNETNEFPAEIKSIDPFGKCITGRGLRTKASGVAFINAVEGCLKSGEKLPVNVKFLAEGEEMYGSNHIPWFIDNHGESLSDVNAVYVPSMSQGRNGNVRSINLGGKGFLGYELVGSGADWGKGPQLHDVHSSSKALVDSPMWRLVEAINTLVSNSGQKILLDGFFENVRPLTENEINNAENLYKSFNEEALKKRMGVDEFLYGKEGIDVLKQNLFDPTLNIEGIPYTSVDPVGVVAHEARAKFQSRIVPNQSVEEIFEKLRSHLDTRGYEDIKINKLYGFGPGRTNFQEPIIQAVSKLYQDAGLETPVVSLGAASSPVNAFNNSLGLPCAGGGLGHSGRDKGTAYLLIKEHDNLAGLVGSERSFIKILENYAAL